MSEISGRIYEFGDFQLDTAESVLRRAGEIVPLTPKAVQALTLLVESGGHVLSRTSLIEALWPDAFVEEANLTVTISMLRKALGEHENKLKFIETVPKRGYRFVATVKAMSVSTTPSRAEVGDALHHVPAPVAASGRKWRLPLLVGACGLVAVTLAYILYSVIARPPSPSTDKRGAMRLTQLTDDGNVRDVTISPDGSYLAFVLIEKGREGLWVRNLVTNEKWQVLPPQEGICWGPRFTLDGQNLYYVTTAPDSTISVLYRIGLRGGSPQRIV
ncbi:MAG TPA: winged helix-turn-helix domain-containing protein, partial [Pyrinomonadaceae bacterium]|nr:winged helix-turn-helix domain-containing protein [Pyrinomonadaceae bacterium]